MRLRKRSSSLLGSTFSCCLPVMEERTRLMLIPVVVNLSFLNPCARNNRSSDEGVK